MISVQEAQAQILTLGSPLPAISVPVAEAVEHYLADDIVAKRTQPAADLSAMDGYAIRFADMPGPWRIIGESAAGRPFDGRLDSRETVRIFTGAHVPDGADCIMIQEDASQQRSELALLGQGPHAVGAHIRRMGSDFAQGDHLLTTGTRLTAGAIASAIMAGYGTLLVGGRPKISIIASGDELRPPGIICDAARIPSSNNIMLAAMLNRQACIIEDKGIVADKMADLEAALLGCAGSDIIVTSGGASVGDHDLVQQALRNIGAEIEFWKVAMRPGKPVMAGRVGNAIVLGLPGNPASAFVTAQLFLLPLARHLAGSNSPFPSMETAILARDLPAGGLRTEYLRACQNNGLLSTYSQQDSGLLAPLSSANALVINPADSPARAAGSKAQYLRID